MFKFKTKPFKHQEDTFELIKDLPYYALFWEMGTGKTKMAIDWLRYKCYQENRVMNTLIICPNIATDNWMNELSIHSFSKNNSQILRGSGLKRATMLASSKHQINIINFEGVLTIAKDLFKHQFDVIIVDESQRIKNYQAKSTKIIIMLKSRFRLILSGTPILNSPMDIFSQYLFLDKGKSFGINFYSFRNQYFEDKNAGFKAKKVYFPKYEVREDMIEVIRDKMHTIADVRKKNECLDLPDKVYITYKLEMDAETRKMYFEMEKELITFFENNPEQAMVASNAAVKYIRLEQISSGFISLDESHKEIRLKTNHKLAAVKEMLEDITKEHKVIIWAVHRNNLKMLQEELKQYNPAALYGGIDDKLAERNKFDNDATCRVMIANPQTAKTAINMVVADYALYYSQNFSAENRWQSEDRCHRSGSEIHDKITYIDFVYNNSIDEIIIAALKNKEDMATVLLKLKERLEEDVYGTVR